METIKLQYNSDYFVNKDFFKSQVELATRIFNLSVEQKTPGSAIIPEDLAFAMMAIHKDDEGDWEEDLPKVRDWRGDLLVDYLAITGSNSQGLAGPNSDTDFKGVINLPIWTVRPDLIVDVVHTADNNITLFSCRKWRELLFDGNYDAVEAMSVETVVRGSKLFFNYRDLYDSGNGKMFLTHRFFNSALGFVRSQIDKAKNNVLAQVASGEFNPDATFDDFITVHICGDYEKCLPKKELTLSEFLTILRTKHPSYASQNNTETRNFIKSAVLSDRKTYIFFKEADLDVECGIYRDDPMTSGGNIMQPSPRLTKDEERKLLNLSIATIDVDRKRFKQHLVLLKALEETKKDPETLRVGYAPKAMCHAIRAALMCLECFRASVSIGSPQPLHVNRSVKPDYDTLKKIKYPPQEGHYTLNDVINMATRLCDELQKLLKEDEARKESSIFPPSLPEKVKNDIDTHIGIVNLTNLQRAFYFPGEIDRVKRFTNTVNYEELLDEYFPLTSTSTK